MIERRDITGLVLAGGQGSRMGGIDKGLQSFRGQPLVQHALQRLSPQVHTTLVSANRHLDRYRSFGAPVLTDSLPGHAGPLAGFLAGLQHCRTEWLACVPCDSPMFPLDLVERLAHALRTQGGDIAIARTGTQLQPVFCLMKTHTADSLMRHLDAGGRRIERWCVEHGCVEVPFEEKAAFANANTLEELQKLESAHD